MDSLSPVFSCSSAAGDTEMSPPAASSSVVVSRQALGGILGVLFTCDRKPKAGVTRMLCVRGLKRHFLLSVRSSDIRLGDTVCCCKLEENLRVSPPQPTCSLH